MLKIKNKIEDKGTIRSKKVIDIALRLASNKGDNTIVYDIHNNSPLITYAIITTASSSRRLFSLADEAIDALKDNGFKVNHKEGKDDSSWMLVDAGYIVVHVFTPEERKRINLEELYQDCARKIITSEDVKQYLKNVKYKNENE